jgi:hypothetical protein
MRNRHRPRLCGTCTAPVAGDEEKCRRCGEEWAPENEPRTKLRLVPAPAAGSGTFADDVAAAVRALPTR